MRIAYICCSYVFFLSMTLPVLSATKSLLRSYRRRTLTCLSSSSSFPEFTFQSLPDETIYILDGTGMLYYAYHAGERAGLHARYSLSKDLSRQVVQTMKSRNASWVGNDNDLIKCGSLVSMADNLVRFVKKIKPKYLAVAFDAGKKTFRHNLYPDYKKQRSPTPADLQEMFRLAPLVCELLGVRCYEQAGFEGDDLMASIGHWSFHRGLNVVHVTIDKDMSQLVRSGVHVMDPRSHSIIGENEVVEKYGVRPESLCDLWSLTGDSADNIPGVKGIGQKTANAFINHFGTVENIYDSIFSPMHGLSDEERLNKIKSVLNGVRISPSKVLKSFQSTTLEEVLIFKRLLKLQEDVPLPFNTATSSPRAPQSVVSLIQDVDYSEEHVLNPALSVNLSVFANSLDGKEASIVSKSTGTVEENRVPLANQHGPALSVTSSAFAYSVDVKGTSIVSEWAEAAVERCVDDDLTRSAIDPVSMTETDSPVLTTSHFRYLGEKPEAMENLALICPDLTAVLERLRYTYHTLERHL